MIVAATTENFSKLSLSDALQRIADLEYTAVEIAIADNSNHITPSDVARDRNEAHAILRKSHRLEVTSFYVEIGGTGAEHYQQFEAICELARICKGSHSMFPLLNWGLRLTRKLSICAG